MIDVIDLVIRQTLSSRIGGLPPGHVGFQPPDEDWRRQVSTSGHGVFVNCYLVDLREDRRLRQTGYEPRSATASATPRRGGAAPVRVRCLYLISAWNGAKDSPQVAATEQEHAVLGAVMGALVASGSLEPAAVLTPSQLAALPDFLREASLPVELLPAEGFPKTAEFWGTMGRPAPWKPVVPLMVTVPVPEHETTLAAVVRSVSTLFSLGPGQLVEIRRQ